jgi:hypothetical protein
MAVRQRPTHSIEGQTPAGRDGAVPKRQLALRGSLTQAEQIELLMHEYDAISDQMAHWNNLFWQMSQFFVAVEAVSLGIAAQWLLSALESSRQANVGQAPAPVVAILCFASATSLFLCYSWFRTGRSHLEHRASLVSRARQIEDEPLLAKTLRLYHQDDAFLRDPSRRKHSCEKWIQHIPSAFMVSWLAVLAAAAAIALSQPSIVWLELVAPVLVAIAAVVTIALAELRGWPGGWRGGPPSEHPVVAGSNAQVGS